MAHLHVILSGEASGGGVSFKFILNTGIAFHCVRFGRVVIFSGIMEAESQDRLVHWNSCSTHTFPNVLLEVGPHRDEELVLYVRPAVRVRLVRVLVEELQRKGQAHRTRQTVLPREGKFHVRGFK